MAAVTPVPPACAHLSSRGLGRAAARSHEVASAGHSGAAARVCLLLCFSLSFPNLGLEMTL